MSRNVLAIGFGLIMVALIVTLDIVFFRHRTLARLIANVSIVIVFILIYLIFIRNA